MAASSWGGSYVCFPGSFPLTKNTPFSISIINGEWCWRGGYSSMPACDSLTCTLIGSSRNLLSWMLCAGIGSSLQREHGHTARQEERQRGRRPKAALLTTWRGKIERGGVREEKGEYPVFSALLCYCSPPLPLPLSLILFLSLSPYSSVSVAALRGRAPAAP